MMKIAFEPAALPEDLDALLQFDAQVFRKPDRFDARYWRQCRPFWMLADGVRAGCCAFQEHIDFREDLGRGATPALGSLYICTTGILPVHQGRGLGKQLKRWEIEYARSKGFTRLITNTRKSNTRMIDLNHQFGFQIVRVTPGYYARPREATVVMELPIRRSSSG